MSSGKKISTSQIIPIFIIKLTKPKVSILKGRVINFNIGFINKLISPNKIPENISVFQDPKNSTPGTNWAANHMPKIP